MSASARPSPRQLRRRKLPFWLLASAILLITAGAVAHALNQQRDKAAEVLHAIAELKALQIADWLKERQGNAEFVKSSQFFALNYIRWQKSGDLASGELLQRRLDELRRSQGFSAILLLDDQGTPLWDSNGTPLQISAPLRQRARLAAADLQIHTPYDAQVEHPHLDFIAPLVWAGARPPLVVMRSDPAQWLYRTLQTWPIPSPSGAIVLLRRDGSQVILPTDGSARGAEALHLPGATEALLRVQTAQGKANGETLLEIKDQRGTAVLGVVHAIPGSEWFLLAKMDKAEVYGHARQDALWITLAGLLALGMAAAGAYLMRQRQQLALAAEIQHSQAERLHTLSLMAALSESSDDAIFAKDQDCRFILFNRAAAHFVGKSAGEVLGQDARAIFPAEQAESLLAVDRQVLADNRFFTREDVLATREGERIFHSTKGPLRDAQGQVIGIFGISRDITERRQAEIALRESEATYRSLFENMINGYAHCRMLFTDGVARDFVYLDVNKAFSVQTGLQDVQGKSVSEIIPGIRQSDPGLFEIYSRVALSGQAERFETHVAALNMWFAISVYSPRREYFVAIFEAITERKNAELALRRQAAELQSRNDELERFNRAVVGRELSMIELKQQVNALCRRLGEVPPYPLSFLDDPTAEAR